MSLNLKIYRRIIFIACLFIAIVTVLFYYIWSEKLIAMTVQTIATKIAEAPTSKEFIQQTSVINLKFIKKVSEIYPPGFLYSPSSICDNNLQLLIIVTSAPANFEARNAIRKTWGQFNSTNPVKLLFIVGSSIPKNEKKLNEENAAHADLIHGHFVDSYNNLTLKTISMLEWVKKNCKSAKFILKADDDTFINVNKLLELTESRINDTKSIYGRILSNLAPHRHSASKWFVSVDEYEGSLYPNFATGPAYLMASDSIEILYNQALKEKFLKLEDVFVAIVADHVGIKMVHVNEFFNLKPNNVLDKCEIGKYISIHYISDKEQFVVSRTLKDVNKKC